MYSLLVKKNSQDKVHSTLDGIFKVYKIVSKHFLHKYAFVQTLCPIPFLHAYFLNTCPLH